MTGSSKIMCTDGKFNPRALEMLARSYVELKLLDQKPEMTKLYTEDFLPKEVRRRVGTGFTVFRSWLVQLHPRCFLYLSGSSRRTEFWVMGMGFKLNAVRRCLTISSCIAF